MKNSERYYRNLLKKAINETLESKADKLMHRIKDLEETYGDDEFTRGDNRDFNPRDYKKVNYKDMFKNLDRDSLTPEEDFIRDIDLDDELYGDDEMDPYIEGDDDVEPISEGEMCECGGMMNEGECTECGEKYEGIHDVAGKFPKKQSFDYIEEYDDFEDDYEDFEEYDDFEADYEDNKNNEDVLNEYCNEDSDKFDEERCEIHQNMLNEELKGKQKKLDKNKNNKIDTEDFKLLRKSKKSKNNVEEEEEVEEGNAFTAKLAKTTKGGEFKLGGKKFKDKSNYDLKKESIEYHIKDRGGDIIKLSENEIINLIENLVVEQKALGLKTIGKPKGLTVYEKAHKGSGKENKEYFKSLETKMKDYLKDGSKGKFDMNPKMFPKGNGELAKMDKKAYKMSDDLEDFNYEIAGQNFPIPDAIDYNDEWMDKLFDGDSMTGNAPGGNALESETNKRFNKMRKKNTLKKLKDQSYKRVPQPVFNEKTGTENGKGLNIKLESIDEKNIKVLNEEFSRMKQLFGYNRKTQ